MAARFRKIDPRIWTDEGFRKLNHTERLIALYVLTAQSNRIGLFVFSPGKAAEDLETLLQSFAKGFAKVCQVFHWRFDKYSRVLYIPTWWKYNRPENANNVLGNLKDLDDLPQNPFFSVFSKNLMYLDETLHQTFTQTVGKRYPKRSPPQEQEQKQEPEQEQEKERAGLAPPAPANGSHSNRIHRDEEFLEALRTNAVYQGINIETELGKLDAWLLTPKGRGKKKTRQRIVNWLNRAVDEQRAVDCPSAASSPKACIRKVTNGHHRPVLCGNPVVSGQEGKPKPFCAEHLEEHVQERRRIDAQLKATQ